MKSIVFLLTITLLTSLTFSQSYDIYGLWFENTNTSMVDTLIDPVTGDTVLVPNFEIEGNQHLVSLDPFTGLKTSLGIIDGVEAVALGTSTFDQGNDRYIFWGQDTVGDSHIYNVELNNAFITNNAPFSNTNSVEFEYDMQFNRLFGLEFEITSFDSLTGVIGGNEYFVELDVQSGQSTNIALLPDVNAVAIGSSAYDSQQGRYFFVGIDNSNATRLYTINSADGSIIHSPEVSAGQLLYGLAYDEQDSLLLAISYDGSRNFISIDPADASYNILNPVNGIMGLALGGSVYEQQSQHYIFTGLSSSGATVIVVLDGNDGTQLSSAPFLDNVIELQASNYNFAAQFFENPVGIENYNGDLLSIYPNPSKGVVYLPEANQLSFTLVNSLGQTLLSSSVENGAIDLSSYPAGSYWLNLEDRRPKQLILIE